MATVTGKAKKKVGREKMEQFSNCDCKMKEVVSMSLCSPPKANIHICHKSQPDHREKVQGEDTSKENKDIVGE